MRLLRLGELVTAGAAIALLLLLTTEWFAGQGSAAGSLGIVLVVLLIGLGALGLGLAALTVLGRPVAWPVAAAVAISFLGILLWPVLALRTLVFGPGDGEVELAGWLGLLAAALIPAGGWLTMADERKDAPESAYDPPPARPIPGSST